MRRKIVESRTDAQRAIAAGQVLVDGVPAPKAATLVDDGASVRLRAPAEKYVSRGGRKLEAALEAFPIAVEGRRAIDIGASTGGFTDCLLRRGAAEVVAVDVGYGQLHWTLRTDRRVRVVERTNIRHADLEELGGPFDIVVADLSFISLATVAEKLAEAGNDGADWILLVKPQFELDPTRVARGGVVRAEEDRRAALFAAAEALSAAGLGVHGAVRSPVVGAKSGNIEFLLWLRRGEAAMAPEEMEEAVT